MFVHRCLAGAIAVQFLTVVSAQEGRRIEGYLKRDVVVFNGAETLRRGEKISCTVKDVKRCCYEDHLGTACIDVNDISEKKVSKRDAAISSVSVNQSANAQRDACADGVPYQERSDAFVWSYGVRLNPQVDGHALILVSYYARRGGLTYPLSRLARTWTGTIDGACHPFNFTRKDIAAFLHEYETIRPYLDAPIDQNIKVEVWIEVFADFEEETYRNNIVKIGTLLPVDSAANWP